MCIEFTQTQNASTRAFIHHHFHLGFNVKLQLQKFSHNTCCSYGWAESIQECVLVVGGGGGGDFFPPLSVPVLNMLPGTRMSEHDKLKTFKHTQGTPQEMTQRLTPQVSGAAK